MNYWTCAASCDTTNEFQHLELVTDEYYICSSTNEPLSLWCYTNYSSIATLALTNIIAKLYNVNETWNLAAHALVCYNVESVGLHVELNNTNNVIIAEWHYPHDITMDCTTILHMCSIASRATHSKSYRMR